MLKKIMGFIMAACMVMFFFSACELGESHELDGDWTITTTWIAGPDHFGDGTFSLHFDLKFMTLEAYIGHGTLGGVDFDFYAYYDTASGDLLLDVYLAGEDPDTSDNDILFDGNYTSGNPVVGTYEGGAFGVYDGDTGNFTADKL
jgi:hypothetical protein